MTRSEKSARLRSLLAPYRGSTFSSATSGGARNMVFCRDDQGRDWFVGSLNEPEVFVEVLNLVMELMEPR